MIKGKRITSLDELYPLAIDRRAVITSSGWKSSAAFFVSMKVITAWQFIERGLFVLDHEDYSPELLQSLKEARELLIHKGYKRKSVALAGINAIIKKAGG